ncbi:MAG: RNA polymerase sigma factor [Acidobacteriota bacterium]
MRRNPGPVAVVSGPRPGEEDDAALVSRARGGDSQAFEVLYRRTVGRIYALCLRMSGDQREAEELTQDVFVRAWQKLDAFRGESAFTTWLHRLAVNVVLGEWRKKGRHRERVVAMEDAESTRREPRIEMKKGEAVDLEKAIATLPAGARTVFVLHDIEGFKHKEIADLTGLAVGTSKAQLHRARQLLREVLS